MGPKAPLPRVTAAQPGPPCCPPGRPPSAPHSTHQACSLETTCAATLPRTLSREQPSEARPGLRVPGTAGPSSWPPRGPCVTPPRHVRAPAHAELLCPPPPPPGGLERGFCELCLNHVFDASPRLSHLSLPPSLGPQPSEAGILSTPLGGRGAHTSQLTSAPPPNRAAMSPQPVCASPACGRYRHLGAHVGWGEPGEPLCGATGSWPDSGVGPSWEERARSLRCGGYPPAPRSGAPSGLSPPHLPTPWPAPGTDSVSNTGLQVRFKADCFRPWSVSLSS